MPHSGLAFLNPYEVFDKLGLTAGARVADCGCGRTGHFVFPAAKLVGASGVVFAVDILKDVLANIQSRVRTEGFDNVHSVWSDIEAFGKTPIPERSLDACFFVNVMWSLKEKAQALSEAARLLKDGGAIVVVEWQKRLGALGPEQSALVPAGFFINWAAGYRPSFAVGASFAVSDYHYCLILRKPFGNGV